MCPLAVLGVWGLKSMSLLLKQGIHNVPPQAPRESQLLMTASDTGPGSHHSTCFLGHPVLPCVSHKPHLPPMRTLGLVFSTHRGNPAQSQTPSIFY